jgi:hypothetical protein
MTPPELIYTGRQVLPSELSRAGLLLAVSANFFLVVSSYPTKQSRIIKNISVLATAAALPLSPSSWFLLRLLQALS